MKRPAMKAAMNMTSMLDVIFILLIFFIAVSRLRDAKVDLRLPSAEGQAANEQAVTESILTIAVDASDGIHLNGRKIAGADELLEILKKEKGSSQDDRSVSVLADRDSHSGRLVEALRAVREAGFTRVSFAYEPRERAP